MMYPDVMPLNMVMYPDVMPLNMVMYPDVTSKISTIRENDVVVLADNLVYSSVSACL